MTIIDKTEDLCAIKQRFGERYHCNEKAHKTAAQLWGVTCNEHGVIVDTQEEILADTGKYKASIYLAQTVCGYWLIGLDVTTPNSGMGYMPSVWTP